jgi:hypothetical protein
MGPGGRLLFLLMFLLMFCWYLANPYAALSEAMAGRVSSKASASNS